MGVPMTEALSLPESMLSEDVRDASYVDPLLELISAAAQRPRWQSINSDWIPLASDPQLELPMVYLRKPENAILDRFVESFVPLPEGEFDVSQYHEAKSLEDAGLEMTGRGQKRRARPIPMSGVSLSSFFVTNELFELYSPWHRKWRDKYSDQDDQPCVHVSWYMARSFTEWLTRVVQPVDGAVYCLPTEWQWEWAVRWGNAHPGEYWWGNDWRDDVAWTFENPECRGERTRGYDHSLLASQQLAERGDVHGSWRSGHPWLLDPIGNVWCWSGSRETASGVFRVLRGSSFYVIYLGDYARSAFRFDYFSPDFRNRFIGFRVVRLFLLPQSSSSPSD